MHITQDDFLGGAIQLYQPSKGYRAGVDPVLLAATVPAGAGQSVLELGCGVGAVSLCLGRRMPDLDLVGIEIQPDYADLARQNAAHNNLPLQVVTADIQALPDDIRNRQFDHVCANPPYFDRTETTPAQDVGRETAMGLAIDVSVWVQVAAKRLKPKGYAHFIFRATGLAQLLAAMPESLGSVVVTPIVPRAGRDAVLVIVHARKNGRAALRLESPIILHKGDHHDHSENGYSDPVQAVLRNGAALTQWYTG